MRRVRAKAGKVTPMNKADLRWLLRMGLKHLGRMPVMRTYTKSEKARLDRMVREQIERQYGTLVTPKRRRKA